MIPFLSDAEISKVLNYITVRETLKCAFASLAAGRAAIKARQRIDCGPVKLSSMGAIWLDEGVVGEKVYPTVDGRFSFLINLFDVSGKPLAVMDANEITRFRTSALTTLVALSTAPSAQKLALFGAGVQGKAHAESLCEAFQFKQIDLVDLTDVSGWCRQLSDIASCPVRQVSADEAISDADLIVTTTRSKQPVFNGSLLKPGATVIAVGTSLPNGRELDDATLSKAGRIIVEWKPQSCIEAGEIVLGKASGAVQDARIVDLQELFAGKTQWRASPDEIVVFKSVGVGLTDISTAWLAHKRHAESKR